MRGASVAGGARRSDQTHAARYLIRRARKQNLTQERKSERIARCGGAFEPSTCPFHIASAIEQACEFELRPGIARSRAILDFRLRHCLHANSPKTAPIYPKFEQAGRELC